MNQSEVEGKEMYVQTSVRDNDKSTQVNLCCGKEVNCSEQYCKICSTKRVNVVEMSTQADFADIDGYVDECLQKQLLEIMQEKSNMQVEMSTVTISITPENDVAHITYNNGMSSTQGQIDSDGEVCKEHYWKNV